MVRAVLVLAVWCVLAQPYVVAGENTDYLELTKRARLAYRAADFSQSETLFLSALRALQPADKILRASTLLELGDVFSNEDQLTKAEHSYKEALQIYKNTSDKTRLALTLRNLGSIYSLQRRDDEALKVLKEALKIAETVPETKPGLFGQILNSIGMVYYRRHDNNKAESYFNEAVQAISPATQPFDRGDLLNNLGTVYQAKHEYVKAEDYYKKSLAVTEGIVGSSHPDVTFTLSELGILYTEMGRYSEAEAMYRRALDILENGKSDLETRVARVLHALSLTYRKAGRKSDAEATLAEASTIARRHIEQHADMVLIVDDYTTTLLAAGKKTEADELRAEARRARMKTALVVNAHSPF